TLQLLDEAIFDHRWRQWRRRIEYRGKVEKIAARLRVDGVREVDRQNVLHEVFVDNLVLAVVGGVRELQLVLQILKSASGEDERKGGVGTACLHRLINRRVPKERRVVRIHAVEIDEITGECVVDEQSAQKET